MFSLKRPEEPADTVRDRLQGDIDQEIAAILDAAERGSRPDAETHFDYLFRFARIKSLLPRQDNLNRVPVYKVGTFFLKECHDYLIQGAVEYAHYVTGIRHQDVRTLDRRVVFRFAEQSSIGISGEAKSTANALMEIDKFGHQLHGWFHSHPGTGPNATMPSSTDFEHQARLESGGYQAIGAIFTRDGHIRFFSQNIEFEVELYGQGVAQIDEVLFRFEDGFMRD